MSVKVVVEAVLMLSSPLPIPPAVDGIEGLGS
jgi:hypothetical protein